MKRILRLAVVLTACLGAFGSLNAQTEPNNTAYGTGALTSDNTGDYNAAFGYDALYTNTSGGSNTAAGNQALYLNTTGNANTATGNQALYENTTGSSNTATGNQALYENTTGSYNTATGENSLYGNTTGSDNTATGESALFYNSTGSNNVAIGYDSLYNVATGSNNIGIGYQAGYNIPASGSYNIEIGSPGTSGDRGVIRLGTPGDQGRFYAAGISGIQISNAVPVYTNHDGQLGTVNSSIRFKEDVHDMAGASNKLFQLRPVTYRYKQANEDGSKPVDYGLIAEEVAQVYPDMVARDASGEILTVQYQKLTPMLLNEVQKQHRQVDALEDQQGTREDQLKAQDKIIKLLEQRLSALESAAPSVARKTPVASEQ